MKINLFICLKNPIILLPPKNRKTKEKYNGKEKEKRKRNKSEKKRKKLRK